MGFIDVNGVSFSLADGRPLLADLAFRVTDGATSALIGANGAGKSTLLRIIRGELRPDEGSVQVDGGLGVMDQFVGTGATIEGTDATVQGLLVSVAPTRIRAAAIELEASETALIERDDTAAQMRYATALAEYAEAGGYDQEVVWDHCTIAALGIPFERAKWRELSTLSGGEQKRLALEALFRGPEQVLLLDEPDNSLDVPGKRWLEAQLRATPKTVLLVSHDRELLARAADRIVTLEVGAAGNTAWVHGGSFEGYHRARDERFERLDELRRRWDEQHAALKTLVATLKVKATYNDGMASRYQAAVTRLRKFEEAGPPEERPPAQAVSMRLRGSRTGKRAVVGERLELTGLMKPFDLEVWYGDRVAVLGSNGSGKSHFLRLLAGGGTEPDRTLGHITTVGESLARVPHAGRAVLGARVVPGWFAQNHEHPEYRGRTLLDILHRGDANRDGMARRPRAPPSTATASRRRRSRRSTRSRAVNRRACRSSSSSSRERPCCCSTNRPTTSTSSRPRRSKRASRASTARCSRSPTTAGSLAASIGSSSSAATARSTSRMPRCGTSPVWYAPASFAPGVVERVVDARSRVTRWGEARRGCRHPD